MNIEPNNNLDTSAYKLAVGEVILARRIDAALNRELFARMAGVGASHLCRIEGGHVSPSVVTLRKLADAFGCTAGELLDEADERLRQTP